MNPSVRLVIVAAIGCAAVLVTVAVVQRTTPPSLNDSTRAPAAPAEPVAPAAPAAGRVSPTAGRIDPQFPSQVPHNGCFVRPLGVVGAAAYCFWTAPDSTVNEYVCDATLAACETDRARGLTLLGVDLSPCTERVAAFCTDLPVRRCRAVRSQCESLRQQYSGTPCVRRETF